MEEFKIKLKAKFAERQIHASAVLKGWQPTVANPERSKAGEPVAINNPLTAEKFLQNVFQKQFNADLVTFEARQSAADAEAKKRKELENELGI